MQPDAGAQASTSSTHTRLSKGRTNAKVLAYLWAHRQKPLRRPQTPHAIRARRFAIKNGAAASTGYIGLRDHGVADNEPTSLHRLDAFIGDHKSYSNFRIIKYLGPATRPIIDDDNRVVGVFAGHEDHPKFKEQVLNPAIIAMEDALASCSISEERRDHRRGNFASFSTGQSYGGGQVRPGTLINGAINTAILLSLLSNSAFTRLAGFATGVFANWSPHLYEYYRINMMAFYRRNPTLKRPFINSIWSACTFNLGPQTCALGHRDFANLAFGWCAITALGNFDYTKGGHLILWDCRLIIEFPPGCTILIPSAAIFHSNIPIAEGERRYSFTQYTAGGIFRWVQHGFQTNKNYQRSLSKAGKRAAFKADAKRWEDGVNLYTYKDEVQID
ncbi:hypothetical protein GGX14DRAFT_376769 [Mycena pura]|uniref:2OGFeDO JBP1/TET oxygenase domain-containing protein n=1 Tax=Mycena pura TaxID=153505 RepID=A0AAD6UVY3_9AGAR|nr:hypothetical protein GGX14DRAFT_376769 [Mycena pura]